MGEHYSVFVNAGAVILMPQDMLEQERLDVLNSVLFAQLVADKRNPNFSQMQAWYETYREVLSSAWLQREVAWKSLAVGDASTFKLTDWVGAPLAGHLDSATRDDVCRVLNRVAQLPVTSPAIDVLREHVRKFKDGPSSGAAVEAACKVSLQVILAQHGPVLNSFYVEFNTTEQVVSNPLGQSFATDNILGNIQLKYFQVNLSDALYGPLREAIIKKLGDKTVKNIFDVSDANQHELAGKKLYE
ncbi:hypothetical protein [Pseudomonas sp. SWRI179]|uniref:hypothetical protein n=1 Tax=Pseudomonas sp. SWRI179 TaxID=2745497 RepID=UPI0016475034|nr:hypothetical protein [Pseudomonas sp. SWRI179]MBC3385957.1 hypothetical protein [Pseudomonas sp. SWRI179]